MSVLKTEFGYYPKDLSLSAGSITIRSLPALSERIIPDDASEVASSWYYAPSQRAREFFSGSISVLPYPKRVFSLPKTHTIEHTAAQSEDHIAFLVWALSFFLGMRLSTTEAGFLDATPITPGQLVDFILRGKDLSRAMDLADLFWLKNVGHPLQSKRLAGAIDALFLAQYPQSLPFERFIYLYTALEACSALTGHNTPPHATRIKRMCERFSMAVPAWADGTTDTWQAAQTRNYTIHEALFMGEPLGFSTKAVGGNGTTLLEMRALTCRLLIAILGGDTDYVRSATNTRQRHKLTT